MTVENNKRLRVGLTKNAKPRDEAQRQERRKMTMSEGLKIFWLGGGRRLARQRLVGVQLIVSLLVGHSPAPRYHTDRHTEIDDDHFTHQRRTSFSAHS